MSESLNEREIMILCETNREAKGFKNADVSITWRNGKLVDIQTTKHTDREQVKATNDR